MSELVLLCFCNWSIRHTLSSLKYVPELWNLAYFLPKAATGLHHWR
jgi:hypothetical protein